MLLAGFLVCLHGPSKASPPEPAQLVLDRIEAGWNGVHNVNLAGLPPKLNANRVGDYVELRPASQLQRAPVVDLRTEDGAENQASKRESPRVRVDEDVNFINHYPGLSLLVLNFFGGLFGALIFGLVRDARRYGINSVWRDLVFDWPIPYWMRFVPKDEQ
ncbi:MAG: hypothetical protein JWL97_4332 [Gemmatimonadales bacterium]|nr:hypothetical protein [Gemmatimonadales bacterium]